MQAEDKRKTLLERIKEILPEPIKEAYENAPRKDSEPHEILRLFAAMYLWSHGYRDITFEKCVKNGGGQNICVDIYESTLGLFVECERFPDKKAIADRRRAIENVYPTSKFVVATQDVMGWKALRLHGVADEVWVVCRDGRVLTPEEWAEERRKTLKTIFTPIELGGYMNLYRETEEEYRKLKQLLGEEEVFWRQILNQACLKTGPFRVDWLNGLNVKGVWSKHVEAAEKRLEEAKTKIVAKVVELLNAIISLSSPYTLKLGENHTIEIGADWDAWQWLGWKDHPSKSPAAMGHYAILEENLQKELKIAIGNIKPKLKPMIERDSIKELQRDIEEIKNMIIPLLVQRLQAQQPNSPARTM